MRGKRKKERWGLRPQRQIVIASATAEGLINKIVVHESVYESYQDKKKVRQRKVLQEIHIFYVCIDEFIIE